MPKRAIFIAATGQHVGKTTLCLGIIAGLKKLFPSVGFIKPVGQQHIHIDPETIVDKDAVLFKKHFHLSSSWKDMSPVIIPSGFTRDYVDKKISEENLLQDIHAAYQRISNANAFTVVEGTGHVGVGSIINLNNVKVASELGLDMVIIASGGLGSAHDELALNISLCQQYGVNIRGVILNRVIDKKRTMIQDYFPRALERWKIPLIGCVPYNAFLDKPTIRDFESLFDTQLISGKEHHYRHFISFRLVAGSVDAFKQEIIPKELIITPATRNDIIFTYIERYMENGANLEGGIILTGRHPPEKNTINALSQTDIPVLYAPVCSFDAMKMITSFTAKIRTKDLQKIERAIKLVEENIDFKLLTNSF
ncbi:putative cobyrinic acid a,c-diamide synthase family protein [Waddlia chondrophila 2032/99]|uniref:Putative cobyrinic acid a,c-diamide synthase family protein n=1 Tax=Waddlia chondrophila 2032/99 TaxID=765953 RepID=F8LD93_9BACT|nr:putative cobyrinic acid a,c-diamide synthase family protein [Waddlia chondrophila 2032/99]